MPLCRHNPCSYVPTAQVGKVRLEEPQALAKVIHPVCLNLGTMRSLYLLATSLPVYLTGVALSSRLRKPRHLRQQGLWGLR